MAVWVRQMALRGDPPLGERVRRSGGGCDGITVTIVMVVVVVVFVSTVSTIVVVVVVVVA